jgi:hypothetical protein
MLKSMILMKYFLLANNCKFYFVDILDVFNLQLIIENNVLHNLFQHVSEDIFLLSKQKIVKDRATDNIHYGPKTNECISSFLYKKYKEVKE